MSEVIVNKALKGAHFLIEDQPAHSIFSPEDFTEEQRMIRDTIRQFGQNDHAAVADRLEDGEYDLNRGLFKTLGDLGLLGAHMPEKYGGMQMDTNTNTLIVEEVGRCGAFSTSFGAHTGIGMLPILYFGTEEQKMKYLPGLISGDKIACYCLTEPGSGSDALAAKTRADLSEDGTHYILNGQKMWISNAGFADVFIVFAKINGTDFTGFIVEKGMNGLSLGAEEKKLGIKGSSTRQVFLENVHVPIENLLGKRGKGHHIAFNVLNTGRYKVGPFSLGAAKKLCDASVKYANERIQFGKKISSFGAVKRKLADQAISTYVAESAVYRTSGLIQDFIEELTLEGKSFEKAKLHAAQEYALESSILKIAMSDILNEVADECVQIHGGMGYSEEGVAARGYRDARITKIYEGTNEINRLLMADIIFKLAMKGKFDLMGPAKKVQKELSSMANGHNQQKNDIQVISDMKKVAIMFLGTLGQMAMEGKLNLKSEQEVLLNVADIFIDAYLAESLYLRYEKQKEKSKAPHDVMTAIKDTFFYEACGRIRSKAREVVPFLGQSPTQEIMLKGIERFVAQNHTNTIALKRKVADYLNDQNSYVL